MAGTPRRELLNKLIKLADRLALTGENDELLEDLVDMQVAIIRELRQARSDDVTLTMTRSHAQALTDILAATSGPDESPARLARELFGYLTNAGYKVHSPEHLFHSGNRQLIFYNWANIRKDMKECYYPS